MEFENKPLYKNALTMLTKHKLSNGITDKGALGVFPVTTRYFDGLLDLFQKDLEAHLARLD